MVDQKAAIYCPKVQNSMHLKLAELEKKNKKYYHEVLTDISYWHLVLDGCLITTWLWLRNEESSFLIPESSDIRNKKKRATQYLMVCLGTACIVDNECEE